MSSSRRLSFVVPFLVLTAASPFARAQEPTAAAPSDEQVRLAPWIGTWDVTATNFEGDQPRTMHAVESTSPVCQGLWLRSKVTGTDVRFEGLSFTGWDATAKIYRGVWVDSMTAAPSLSHGSYDEKTKTFTFEGTMQTPTGEVATRSTLVFDGDTRHEVIETIVEGAKGKKLMEIHSVRQKTAKTAPASASKTEPVELEGPSPHVEQHKTLAHYVGKWNSRMAVKLPDGQTMPMGDLVSHDTSVCDGLWIETRVDGAVQGANFQGYGLLGYDSEAKCYVNFWIDSMAPYMAQSKGQFDAASRTMTLTGDSVDMTGQAVTLVDKTVFDDAGGRVITMTSTYKKDGSDAGTMTIDCKKAK